jgi:hypothetical protein
MTAWSLLLALGLLCPPAAAQFVPAVDECAWRLVKLLTQGCHNLTFPSFSRLTEIQAFAE